MEIVNYKMIAKVYDLLDVIYFTKHGINPRKFILKAIPLYGETKILELCCGTMSNSILIAQKRENSKIDCVDRSPEMLQIAQEKLNKDKITNITIHQQDATATDFANESYDFVILSLVLHEMEEALAKKILEEAHRVLKSNGKLLVLEWEESSEWFHRFLFYPVKKSEPEPFRKFFYMDKPTYFLNNKFSVFQEHHCDYSCVYILNKEEAVAH